MGFVLSYAIIIMSYLLIVTFLFKAEKKRNQIRPRPPPVRANSQMEVRVACTLAIVIAVFTVCWFPLIVTMFATGEKLVRPKEPAHKWFRTLALSNSAMNFLIYSVRIPAFREACATCIGGCASLQE